MSDTRAWLRRAALDPRAGELDLGTPLPLLGDAAFHCQQAAEKSLKAFLTWHDAPFRRTHDLTEIGQQCAALDRSLEDICRRAQILTAYAWVFRYPGDDADPTSQEIIDALTIARDLHQAIVSRLPAEARS